MDKLNYFEPQDWVQRVLNAIKARNPDERYGEITSFTFADLRHDKLCDDEDDWTILTNRLASVDGNVFERLRGTHSCPDLEVREAFFEMIQPETRIVDLREVAQRVGCELTRVTAVVLRQYFPAQIVDELPGNRVRIGSVSRPAAQPVMGLGPRPDARLLDLYEPVASLTRLGEGASGTVLEYKLRRQTTWASRGTVVALKVTSERDLARQHGSVEKGRTRLLREFLISRSHSSERLFRAHDLLLVPALGGLLGPTRDYVLVMDRVAGEALDLDVLARMNHNSRLHAAAELAAAVAEFHAIGGVHRDIKPRNAIRRPDALVVLVDYGIAKTVDYVDVTEAHESGMTPLYAAPEVLRTPETATKAADVYSLGCSVFEILEARRAFDAVSRVDVVVEKRRPLECPPESVVAKVVRQMTMPNPEDRPSAAEVRDALRAIVSASTPTPTGKCDQ